MKNDIENKLKVLSKWLINSRIDDFNEGQMEYAINSAKTQVKQEIGEYLEEILNADDEFIKIELEYEKR